MSLPNPHESVPTTPPPTTAIPRHHLIAICAVAALHGRLISVQPTFAHAQQPLATFETQEAVRPAWLDRTWKPSARNFDRKAKSPWSQS